MHQGTERLFFFFFLFHVKENLQQFFLWSKTTAVFVGRDKLLWNAFSHPEEHSDNFSKINSDLLNAESTLTISNKKSLYDRSVYVQNPPFSLMGILTEESAHTFCPSTQRAGLLGTAPELLNPTAGRRNPQWHLHRAFGRCTSKTGHCDQKQSLEEHSSLPIYARLPPVLSTGQGFCPTHQQGQ